MMHIICSEPKNGFLTGRIARSVSQLKSKGICIIMAKHVVPGAKDALDRFKMESAGELGINLKNGYNGDLTSKQAGSVGGQMVKKMVEKYRKDMNSK